MVIGSGIFLIVVGAVLAFAVNADSSVIDVDVVGWICMAAGVVAIIVSLIVSAQARNTTHREIVDENVNERHVER
ncbi:MAG: DUF6458 family protein [Actinomycetes bacterium]|nr:MAG: hypothetical protein DIU73_06375 [Actinomycetota bacterium]